MAEHQQQDEAQEPNEPRASARADSNAPCATTPDGDSSGETHAPDIDRFFCLHCYDLTGHSGDERRCPECGQSTSTGELIARQLATMHFSRSFEPVLIPSLLFLGPMTSVIVCLFFLRLVLPWLVSAALLFAWASAVIYHYKRCGHLSDWLWFMCESHLVALLLSLGMIAAAASAIFMLADGVTPIGLLALLGSGALLAVGIKGHKDLEKRLPAYRWEWARSSRRGIQ